MLMPGGAVSVSDRAPTVSRNTMRRTLRAPVGRT